MEKKLSARRPFRAAAGETAQDDWEVNRRDPRVVGQLAFLLRLKESTNVHDAWRRDAWRRLPPKLLHRSKRREGPHCLPRRERKSRLARYDFALPSRASPYVSDGNRCNFLRKLPAGPPYPAD
jgi:hypothetical protein